MRNWIANIIERWGLKLVLYSKKLRPKKRNDLEAIKNQINSAIQHLDKQEADIVDQVSKIMDVLK